MAVKRVLVPVDFSPPSLRALEYAISFGRRFKAELEILFVIEADPQALVASLGASSARFQSLLQTLQDSAEAQLSRLAARLRKRRVRFRARVEIGHPHEVIVDQATRRHAALIIMATHGRTGLSHVLVGSVAERVVRTAKCPVLTVRAPASAALPKRTV